MEIEPQSEQEGLTFSRNNFAHFLTTNIIPIKLNHHKHKARPGDKVAALFPTVISTDTLEIFAPTAFAIIWSDY